jgi:probable HAF family extracellular repeat protein
MRQGKSAILISLLAGAAAACSEDTPQATGPSPAPESQAVAGAAATYTIKNIGTLGGLISNATDINNMGQTVGWARTSGDKTHAFIYQAGVMKDLGALSGGHSEASAINDAGVVVGYSTVLSGAERAVRWQNGTKKNLGTLGGRNSRATDINEDGVIVGYSDTKSGNRHAFVYQNGVMKDIGTMGGKNSEANGINKAGKVVGMSEVASGKRHAFAWVSGKFQDLGTGGTDFGFATAVNSGRIVGGFGPPPGSEGADLDIVQPWVLSAGVFTRIGVDRHTGIANDVNKDGIVVGRDEDDRFQDPGNAWYHVSGGTTQYLPELVDDGWDSAEGINSFGTIVGYSEAPDGWSKAVIWRPQ